MSIVPYIAGSVAPYVARGGYLVGKYLARQAAQGVLERQVEKLGNRVRSGIDLRQHKSRFDKKRQAVRSQARDAVGRFRKRIKLPEMARYKRKSIRRRRRQGRKIRRRGRKSAKRSRKSVGKYRTGIKYGLVSHNFDVAPGSISNSYVSDFSKTDLKLLSNFLENVEPKFIYKLSNTTSTTTTIDSLMGQFGFDTLNTPSPGDQMEYTFKGVKAVWTVKFPETAPSMKCIYGVVQLEIEPDRITLSNNTFAEFMGASHMITTVPRRIRQGLLKKKWICYGRWNHKQSGTGPRDADGEDRDTRPAVMQTKHLVCSKFYKDGVVIKQQSYSPTGPNSVAVRWYRGRNFETRIVLVPFIRFTEIQISQEANFGDWGNVYSNHAKFSYLTANRIDNNFVNLNAYDAQQTGPLEPHPQSHVITGA